MHYYYLFYVRRFDGGRWELATISVSRIHSDGIKAYSEKWGLTYQVRTIRRYSTH